MMRTKYLLIGLVSMALLGLTSCRGVYQYNNVRTMDMSPTEVRLDLQLDDFELLGETSITVDTRTYLGIFRKIDSINGEEYNFREVRKVKLVGWNHIDLSPTLKKAAYKIVEEYPDADYYVPVYKKREIERLFLGRYQKETAVIKAYKVRQ